MLTVTVDQFEFDNPSTEEGLVLSVARKSDFPYPDVSSFVAASVGVEAATALPQPKPFSETLALGFVRPYFSKFAGVEIPNNCNWLTYVLKDEENECLLILVGPSHFYHYHWTTSA